MTVQDDMLHRYIGKRIKAIDLDKIGTAVDFRCTKTGQLIVIMQYDDGMTGYTPIHLAEIIPNVLPLPG